MGAATSGGRQHGSSDSNVATAKAIAAAEAAAVAAKATVEGNG